MTEQQLQDLAKASRISATHHRGPACCAASTNCGGSGRNAAGDFGAEAGGLCCALLRFATSRSSVRRWAPSLRQPGNLRCACALAGMLVYIAFRFEWIYGVAAVIAVFHDTIITIGLFSLFNKEISLTVVAALLTLVGYSMNDTIVVFDRIRENLKLSKRQEFEELINASINQTLSRTVLTSGLDVPDGAVAVAVRRPGAERVFVRAGDRYYHRNLFVGFHRQPDFGVLAELC